MGDGFHISPGYNFMLHAAGPAPELSTFCLNTRYQVSDDFSEQMQWIQRNTIPSP